MNTPDFMILLMQMGTGILWAATYILIIKRGFEGKTFGMPMAAICANISWEYIFSFVYPHEGPQRIVNIIWFLLDSIIMIQFLIFGRKSFKKYAPAELFYPTFLFSLVLSFLIIMAAVYEFNDFEGKYAAFSQNLMMSILFVLFLLRRGNTSGQSIHIAVLKMIGSLIPAIAVYIFFQSVLINVLSAATFIFDCVYIFLINKFNCSLSKKSL